jgi:hypothetical protein
MVRPHSFVFWGSYSMLQHHQEFHGISQSQDVGVQNASHSCHGWQPRTPNLAELWITEHDPGDFFPPSVIFRQFLGIENMIQRINHAYPGSTNPIHLLPSNSLAITQPCSKPCAVELVEVETICQLFASTTKKRSDTWILSTIYGSIMIYIYIDIHPSNQISIQQYRTVYFPSEVTSWVNLRTYWAVVLSHPCPFKATIVHGHNQSGKSQPYLQKNTLEEWTLVGHMVYAYILSQICFGFVRAHTHRSNHISPLISIGVWAKKHKPYLWVAIIHLPGYQNFIPGYLNGLHAENLWIK